MQYDKYGLGHKIQVFCVSNVLYRDWRRKPKIQSEPWLRLSGIIGLRRYCMGLTDDAQLRSLQNYLSIDIPALLGNVSSWVQAGAKTSTAEQKENVRAALDELQEDLEEVRIPPLLGADTGVLYGSR